MIRQAYQSFRLNLGTSFVSAETKLKMSIFNIRNQYKHTQSTKSDSHRGRWPERQPPAAPRDRGWGLQRTHHREANYAL